MLHIKITHFNDDLLSSLQLSQVSHFGCKCLFLSISVVSVAYIIQSSFQYRFSNDITRTLETPSKTCLRRRNHLMRSTKHFPRKKPLKNIFGRKCSPTHCQGVPTLPILLWGSVATLCAPFWGSTSMFEKKLGC